MVFHGFSWFFMVPGSFLWFFIVPGLFFVVLGRFSGFYMVPGWFFMVFFKMYRPNTILACTHGISTRDWRGMRTGANGSKREYIDLACQASDPDGD